jgi:DNA polymerase-3 subunit gamma/tau
VHVRTLAELAVVRICELENLDDLPRLVAQLRQESSANPASPAERGSGRSAEATPRRNQTRPGTSGNPAPVPPPSAQAPKPTGGERAKPAGGGTQNNPTSAAHQAPSAVTAPPNRAPPESPAPNDPATSQRPKVTLTDQNARQIWDETLTSMGDMTAESAARYSRIAISAPNTLEVTFSKSYTAAKAFCERPEKQRQLEQALSEAVGSQVRLTFQLEQTAESSGGRSKPRPSQRELIRETSGKPLVRDAMELFDAHINRVDLPRKPPSDGGE